MTGPKVKDDFPCSIREIENIWIPLSDGTGLAARIWLPENAHDMPVPAVLEYIPYRKDDATARGDARRHAYFAGHGYASVRVDIRGTGSSDGILIDEYLPKEQDDAIEVINWLEEQPWCSGHVGMIGISWGGFNGLQVAARRPRQLKAIVTVCSTDDRYADDVHYIGGCIQGFDMLEWASTMLARNAMPPPPSIVGDKWRDMWLQRLEETPAYIEPWLTHQRRDSYWKHGSICENYSDVECAVYAVGGWADGYTNAVPRLLEGLSGPRKGLIGPWVHIYPEMGTPGPAIGFLQECVRWWDYWLKGDENGIMDEPMLHVWMQDSPKPSATQEYCPGRWVAETTWPSTGIENHTSFINSRTLDESPEDADHASITGSELTGRDAGRWCPYGRPGDYDLDQRAEDGLSLTFTSTPLNEDLNILGFPTVNLSLAVDQPNALVAVRLCDVTPTGESRLITRGVLNLTHREGHEFPAPLSPGERYDVTVKMDVIGWTVPAGHQLRLAISPTYWPWAWPSPRPVTLKLFTGQTSCLSLPVRKSQRTDTNLDPFEPPEVAAPLQTVPIRQGRTTLTTNHDPIGGVQEINLNRDDGRYLIVGNGIELEMVSNDAFHIQQGQPLSAKATCHRTIGFAQGEIDIRVETASTMTSDETTFRVKNVIDAYESDVHVYSKAHTFTVPRDHV